jgi:hypothetical protein
MLNNLPEEHPPPSYEEAVYTQVCRDCSSFTGSQCSYCKSYYCTLHLTSGVWKNTSGNTTEGILCNLCYERLVDKPERAKKKMVIPRVILVRVIPIIVGIGILITTVRFSFSWD